MWSRCTNRDSAMWHLYGGRGITVDEAWKSFDQFIADMGPRPEGMTLDRKDSNLGYSKDNCRWATPKKQAQNTSRSYVWIYEGIEYPSSYEVSRQLGVHVNTVYRRCVEGKPGFGRRPTYPKQGAIVPTPKGIPMVVEKEDVMFCFHEARETMEHDEAVAHTADVTGQPVEIVLELLAEEAAA